MHAFVVAVVLAGVSFAARSADALATFDDDLQFVYEAVADATLAYHKKGSIEYIPFPDKLKGRYQAFTQADLTNLRAAGYDKPFKTVAEGVTEYMAWLNRDA